MKLRTILFVAGILLLALILGLSVIFFSSSQDRSKEKSPSTFSVLENGTAGGFGYAVFTYRGEGNITALSYPSKPSMKITIINDSQAIEATKLSELFYQLKPLEKYGYSISITDKPLIGSGLYIVPTGALPSYALFNLQQNSSNGTIIYIGSKDLIVSSGIKKLSWYSSLQPDQQSRVVQYEGTLDSLLESNISLADDILKNKWMVHDTLPYSVSESGTRSAVIGNSGYLRLIYDFDDLHGVYDSSYLEAANQSISPSPQNIFPWEKASLQFTLNKTNGTAFLSIRRNGKIIEHEELRRVTDENVFIKKLEYSEPGEYILSVDDNSGAIASGLLHVKDVDIKFLRKQGVAYLFSVMVDSRPLESSEAIVSVGNSAKKKFFISGGEITVNAKLEQGKNTFNFELSGTNIPVVVENTQDPLPEFYIKYGIPGLAIVVIVYFGARMTRRPSYRMRFGESASYVREEITLPIERALEGISKIREDMNLGQAPIAPSEFTIALKRYLTNGADITEGNVEEILKKLVSSGHLENHRDYYQLKNEGDVRKNVLRRMIREKLIESGTQFKESKGNFTTKDFEIGFFGDKFTKKGLLIVDDKLETKRILAALDESARARLKIMQSNGLLSFVPIDRLGDFL